MARVARGDWEVVGDKDWFAVALVAGQSYRFDLTGMGGEVTVVGPNGQVADNFLFAVAQSDSGTVGHFTPRASGTYYFSASNEDLPAGYDGRYAITLTEVADDFADNIDSTGAFANNVAAGRVEQPGDADFFAVDLTAFTQYDYSLSAQGGLEVRIVNAAGIPVHFGEMGGTFVPTASGRYFFVVVAKNEASSFTPEDYTLTLTPSATTDDFSNNIATTGVITLTPDGNGLKAGAAAATWNYVTDSDWFRVQLVANETYKIGLTGIDGTENGLVTVVDANGNPIATTSTAATIASPGANNSFAFTPKATGTYYVKADALATPGAYTATVQQVVDDFTDNPTRTGVLGVNSTATGILQAQYDTDWFAVTLTAGASYDVSHGLDQAGIYFGFTNVIAPDGSVLGSNTFSAAISGTYYVAMSGLTTQANPADTGYFVKLNSYVDDFTDNASRVGALAVNGSANGTTEIMGDNDWFAVTLTANQRYVFSSSRANASLRLFDASGAEIGDVRSFTPTVSGTYYVSHTGFTPGGYTVSVQNVPDDFLDNAGTTGRFIIDGSGGGDLVLNGTEGDDGFYLGGAFTNAYQVNGFGGALDQLGLQGNYPNLVFDANDISGLEFLVLLSGTDTRFGAPGNQSFDYNITMNDANVAANQQFVVSFNTLKAGEDVTFNGAAEQDGNFLTYGGQGVDNLTGGQKDDGFYFGTDGRFGPGDKVNGQGGNLDQFGLQGNYSGANALTLAADTLVGIEVVVLLSAGDTRFGGGAATGYSYDLTLNDGNVAAGQVLNISANTLKNNGTLTETMRLNGSAEMDGRLTVFAGDGDDVIIGGRGADQFFGRGGNDRFEYTDIRQSTEAARDQIKDFNAGDKIDLSALDANANAAGGQQFSFVGASAFTGAGQLRVTGGNGSWLVEGETNGDGIADFVLAVTTVDPNHQLGSGDFFFT